MSNDVIQGCQQRWFLVDSTILSILFLLDQDSSVANQDTEWQSSLLCGKVPIQSIL
jgi:hypothetical protein